ncbi:rab15 effector protein [Leucoraja erinacea]|uniref:rab15 effector protein n=1 Tax=Leucoraja erinaceus TaxID=7782 RepID=UPI002457808C|nr:rab15 effector protein [Leucoraja erinacea]
MCFYFYRETTVSSKGIKPLPNMNSNILKDFLKIPEKSSFVQQFNQCAIAASQRVKEYIGFEDPECKLKIRNSMLSDIFLMTYINRSVQCKVVEAISCTRMTEEQAMLMGADWVWAVHDGPSKNPKLQIAVQVIHMEREREEVEEKMFKASESMKLARAETFNKSNHEKIADFCSSIGRDCYGLFLFFGCKGDPKSVCGVLSNDFHARLGNSQELDDVFLLECMEKTKNFVTPGRMLDLILQKDGPSEDSKPICVKFTQ